MAQVCQGLLSIATGSDFKPLRRENLNQNPSQLRLVVDDDYSSYRRIRESASLHLCSHLKLLELISHNPLFPRSIAGQKRSASWIALPEGTFAGLRNGRQYLPTTV